MPSAHLWYFCILFGCVVEVLRRQLVFIDVRVVFQELIAVTLRASLSPTGEKHRGAQSVNDVQYYYPYDEVPEHAYL